MKTIIKKKGLKKKGEKANTNLKNQMVMGFYNNYQEKKEKRNSIA